MSTNISGLGGVSQLHHGLTGTQQTTQKTGEWNGLKVTAGNDPASLLADAAEELTFAASEKVEKDVSVRKKPDKEKRLAAVAPPEEALAEMQQRMGKRLDELLAKLKSGNGSPAALKEALEGFPDPTERHAALDWLEEQCADQPSLAAMVRREREQLEAESGAAIQAGYNISGVDAEATGGEVEGRNLYQRTVLGHEGIGGMLEEILQRHGSGDFAARVDFLRKAVGADLSAANPSTDKRELEAMNNDLYHLRALANFTREFDADLAKLRETGGKAPLPEAGVDTLRILCRAKEERLVVLTGLKGALALEGRADATYDVRALMQAQTLAHKLPAKLFSGEDARQRLLDAGQKLLDEAVDIEDEMAVDE